MLRYIIAFTLICITFFAHAKDQSLPHSDYLLLLTSARNAETIADAARIFQLKYPQLNIQARSDTQLWQMSQKQRQQLIDNSRVVLGIGLYGPSVADLLPILRKRNKPQLIINSDHRLVLASQFKGEKTFTNHQQLSDIAKVLPGNNFHLDLQQQIDKYPKQELWLRARGYWQAGGSDNTARLFAWAFAQLGEAIEAKNPQPTPQLRWFFNSEFSHNLPAVDIHKPVVAIIDHAGGGRPADTKLLRQLCDELQTTANSQCLAALAYWGKAGVDAVQELTKIQPALSAIVMLQDFVIGGGEGRQAVTETLSQLNVPIIKAIKLRDRTALEREFSLDGLAQDKVYYQVAMPELQGASQPLVIATGAKPVNDTISGIQIQSITADHSGISALALRVKRWQALQQKDNANKRLAIIYYNHPPGRHNIGADNLDVPASLWQILQQLKNTGYNTGALPNSQEELLNMMMARGVNLPRDASALKSMSKNITRMPAEAYRQWFSQLPQTVRDEMEQGPFGLLHQQLTLAIAADRPQLAQSALEHTVEEMHHLLEGVDHKARTRALALLENLETCYLLAIAEKQNTCLNDAPDIIGALQNTGIEGLGGWGKAPGKVMTYNDEILLPGLTFGNIFIGPQPPRGWEINEELLHANLAFPPPHQYLAFYHYLRDQFKADALIHLGRHSTYEFLPRRSVGLADDDYSRIIAGDLPGIYPYIVDGVGEGIQAKRRGLAVMVDHLTPPLASTPLYDELLQLRQLVESFEASHGSGNHVLAARLVQQIRDKVDALELKDELAEAMSGELAIMGIGFDDVDDDMLVHEVGHYLTDLQERFMPLGLHIFGKDWQANAIDMMLDSMSGKNNQPKNDERNNWKEQLSASPKAEMAALLNGLNGAYIVPGQGNDPIRSPDSLPTGRNFYALDSSLIPSRTAWKMGQEMAASARQNNQQNPDKREAIILWASDVVRDEGVMIAFGLDMLGLEPVWNSRGLVKGLKRQAPSVDKHNATVRRDVVFTTSGLFRDLYGQQMLMLNRATLMALDASSHTIRKDYPALALPLSHALSALGKEAIGGAESLAQNQVAAHWVTQARELLAAGQSDKDSGVIASLRVFGDAPGTYGAGINRLVERSGAWQKRSQLASVYLRRLGHSYSSDGFGKPTQAAFKRVLGDVENTYFGRSSNLYGLIDNNDAFDYLGGLSLAVETLTGQAPNNFVIDHADVNNIKTRPLSRVLRQELRGRFLNPEWLKAQMQHDYAGARTMGSEFLEYLWGWQVTNPTLVGDWAWEEVKAVYIDDRYNLGLDEFLQQGHNAHVKSNMLAIMLVSIQKEFWQADTETVQQLAEQFAQLVARHGLPGSGHTDFNHPMLPWLEQHLSSEDWQAIAAAMQSAQGEQNTARQTPETHRIAEVEIDAADDSTNETADNPNSSNDNYTSSTWLYGFMTIALLFMAAGFYRGRLHAKKLKNTLQP